MAASAETDSTLSALSGMTEIQRGHVGAAEPVRAGFSCSSMLTKMEPKAIADCGCTPFHDENSRLPSTVCGSAMRAKQAPKRFSIVISAPIDSKSIESSTS